MNNTSEVRAPEEHQAPQSTPTEPTTFSCAVRAYLRCLRANGRAESTLAVYQQVLSRLLAAVGDLPLNSIQPRHLHDSIIELVRRKTRLGPVTLNKVRSVHRGFFRWAHEVGHISRDPSAGLCSGRAQSLPTVPVTSLEVHRLIATIQESGDRLAARDVALFATYAWTGVRPSESSLIYPKTVALAALTRRPDAGSSWR